MKKFFTTLLALTVLGVYAQALNIDETVAANVSSALVEAKAAEEEVTKYPSTDASEKAVLSFVFVSKTMIKDDLNLTSNKTCAAVVIDNEWLLASKTCMVSDKEVKGHYYMGASCPPEVKTCEVGDRWIEDPNIVIGNKKYPVEVISAKGQYLLRASDKLSAALANLPKANILVTGPKAKLEDYSDLKFFVNRESKVFGIKEVQERELGTLCTEKSCISVKYDFWHTDAQSGDPLFVKLDNKMEFLVGFNAAQNYTDGNNRKGRDFKVITKEDMDEIIKIITEKTPKNVPQIVKKTVNKITVVKSYYKYE